MANEEVHAPQHGDGPWIGGCVQVAGTEPDLGNLALAEDQGRGVLIDSGRFYRSVIVAWLLGSLACAGNSSGPPLTGFREKMTLADPILDDFNRGDEDG